MADIHPQLQKDCLILGRFQLSHLLLLNDASYPWFILVPDRAEITEIYQLEPVEQQQLWRESGVLSTRIMQVFQGDKLNIASIGNLVPQLHLHHVVRYRNDRAWPSPVWGKFPPVAYSQAELERFITSLDLSSIDGLLTARLF